MQHECKKDLPNLISRRQFNAQRKLTARLAEEIRKDVAVTIDSSKEVFCIDSKPVKECQNARAKRFAMGRDNLDAAPDWATVPRKKCTIMAINSMLSVVYAVSYILMI